MSHMRKVAFTLVVLFTLCVTTRTAKLASSDTGLLNHSLPSLRSRNNVDLSAREFRASP